MFEKLADILDSKFSTPMAKLAEQRHLKAVRDGIVATLPLIIVSSMFMVIAFLPNSLPAEWGFTQFIMENQFKILLPYRMSMYIMTLYAVFGIGFSLSRSYDLDGLSGGILSELAFLLTIIPKMSPAVTEGITKLAENNQELADFVAQVPAGLVIPMPNLGSAGMFIGILAAFFAVEVYRLTQTSGFKISMPPQVPASVARSFESLTPAAIILLVVATITMFLDIDVHGIVAKIVTPLVHASDTLPSAIVIVFLTTFFWSFGIHGASIVGSLVRPVWLILLDENIQAFADKTMIPNIAAEPFYQWFVWIGGAGSALGLAILLVFMAKSKYLKTLGRTAIVPAIFNINEPIIFGLPIVLNPTLIIPFNLVPLVSLVISWFATKLGLVNPVVSSPAWTLPGPIGAFLATGTDWRAIILSIVLILVSVVGYYPFVKIYDRQLLKEEAGQDITAE